MRAFFLAALLAATVSARGQQISPPRRVHQAPNPGTHEYREPALAVSRVNPKHLVVAWMDLSLPYPIRYAVSLDGAKTFVDGLVISEGCLPGEPVNPVADPMAASSAFTDDLWVGCVVMSNRQQALNVFHNGPNSTSLGPASIVECRQDLRGAVLDKPFFGVGPRQDNPAAEAMYLFFTDFRSPPGTEGGVVQPPGQLFGRITQDLDSLTWAPQRINVRRAGSVVNEVAVAIAPVILTGPPLPGRVVCVWRPTEPGNPSYPLGRTPVSMYTDDGGQSWLPVAGPSSLDHSGDDPIYAVNEVDLPDNAAGVGVSTVPGIAVDPTDSRLVYVVFWGKDRIWTEQNGNVDLYIAQSRDGGAAFPPKYTLHLTDALLNDVADPASPVDGAPVDQVLPAIAVDALHGVNILYYAERSSAAGITFVPRWARIAGFSPGSPQARIISRSLGPTFARPVLTGGSIGTLRDYMMIASSGSLVYAAFTSAHEDGAMNIYVTKVALWPADVVPDGVLDAADLLAFATGLATGTPSVDLDADGARTGMDINGFVGSDLTGCDAP